MDKQFIARQSITINAPAAKVWDALVNPEKIKQYMFGTNAVSDWRRGSPIVFKGEWEGKTYEDKGMILRLEPERLIEYTYFSPLAGLPDKPENYHTITVTLSKKEAQTFLTLTQDNNRTDQVREHSEKNWQVALTGLKKLVEQANKA